MKTAAQLRAAAKYDKEHIRGLYIKINKDTERDILEWIQGRDNVSGSIKGLIRADIEYNKQSEAWHLHGGGDV